MTTDSNGARPYPKVSTLVLPGMAQTFLKKGEKKTKNKKRQHRAAQARAGGDTGRKSAEDGAETVG